MSSHAPKHTPPNPPSLTQNVIHPVFSPFPTATVPYETSTVVLQDKPPPRPPPLPSGHLPLWYIQAPRILPSALDPEDEQLLKKEIEELQGPVELFRLGTRHPELSPARLNKNVSRSHIQMVPSSVTRKKWARGGSDDRQSGSQSDSDFTDSSEDSAFTSNGENPKNRTASEVKERRITRACRRIERDEDGFTAAALSIFKRKNMPLLEDTLPNPLGDLVSRRKAAAIIGYKPADESKGCKRAYGRSLGADVLAKRHGLFDLVQEEFLVSKRRNTQLAERSDWRRRGKSQAYAKT